MSQRLLDLNYYFIYICYNNPQIRGFIMETNVKMGKFYNENYTICSDFYNGSRPTNIFEKYKNLYLGE